MAQSQNFAEINAAQLTPNRSKFGGAAPGIDPDSLPLQDVISQGSAC
jgi:hypothetical protein